MKNFIQTLCAVVLACTVFLTGCSPQTGDSSTGDNVGASARAEAVGQLTVKVLNIGQGDAILIQTGEQNVLIDTGDDKFYEDGKKGTANNMLFNELSKAHVTQIDKLIMTHAHADHIGKAAAVLERYNVKELIYNGIDRKNGPFKKTKNKAEELGIPMRSVEAGDILDFGNGASFEVLNPTAQKVLDDNNAIESGKKIEYNENSIVGKLIFGEFSMMLTGEVESEQDKDVKSYTEQGIIQRYPGQLHCQILKVGHHGSKTSSSQEFLNAVQPEIAVISAGVNNSYGHPHKEVVNRLKNLIGTDNIRCTSYNGTITITTDGSNYWLTSEDDEKRL